MKNIIRLSAVIGLLFGSMIIANAQESNARGLYIAYNPNSSATPGKPKPPVKKPKPPAKCKPSKNKKCPPVSYNNTVANNTGTSHSATGLPGTKLVIELSRNGKFSFVKPTHKFRSGDKIRLRLSTNFDGYISLLNVGSTGEVQFLYPYRGANNRVTPSNDVQIPSSGDWIVFDDNPGTENLTIIMSKESLGESRDNYKSIRQSNSRDLLIEYADDAVYAVAPEEGITKPVGFTLKLKHSK